MRFFCHTIIEVLKTVDVFAAEIFSARRCLAGVTIVDDIVSLFARLMVWFWIRVFIVELRKGVLPVGNWGLARRATADGVRRLALVSD